MDSLYVGRVVEMQRLNQWLSEVLAGHPRMVFISGEVGIGKSRLVEEFLKKVQAANPELVSAVGYCNSHFGNVDPLHPFRAVFMQLFHDSEDSASATDKRRLAKKAGNVLMEIAPDVVGAFIPLAGPALKLAKMAGKAVLSRKTAPPEDDAAARGRLFEQFSRILLWAAKETPVLIVIEDLHWADGSTIDFLFHLARSWEAQRLMVLCTYRRDEIETQAPGGSLENVINNLVRYGLCVQLTMGWLEESDIREWLARLYPGNQFPEDFAQWLYERTKGNSLFVSEILKDLQERKLLLADQGTWTLSPNLRDSSDLPATIIAVLEGRLGRLEKQLKDMLTCASVEGEEFTAQVIAAVRQLDEDPVLDALIEVLGHRLNLVLLKEERPAAQRRWLSLFEFRHSLMQKHIYGTLTPPQKRRLHQQVGECLETLYEGMTEEIAPALARHFSEAKDGEKTLRYAILAAERAERTYDLIAARQWLKLTVGYLPIINQDPLTQANILRRLGRSEAFVGSFPEAMLYLKQALDRLQQIRADEQQADVMVDLGYCYIQTGHAREAIALLERALTINRHSNRLSEAAQSLVQLAFAHHKNARQDLYLECLTRAKQDLEELGDLTGLATVHRHLGIHYRIEGNFELSVQHLEEAAALDRQVGDKFHEASDYTNLGSTYLHLGKDEVQAMAYYRKSLELSHKVSKVHEEGHVLLNIARLYALQGNWSEALQSVNKGLQLSELVQQTPNIIRGLWYRGVIHYYQGRIKEGLEDYQKALSLASGIDESRIKWGVLFNLGSLQLAAEMNDEALNTYTETAMLLLDMVAEMQKQQQTAFFIREEKTNVFRALQELAVRMGQVDSIDPLMKRLPVETTINAELPVPKFYWGGGEWR